MCRLWPRQPCCVFNFLFIYRQDRHSAVFFSLNFIFCIDFCFLIFRMSVRLSPSQTFVFFSPLNFIIIDFLFPGCCKCAGFRQDRYGYAAHVLNLQQVGGHYIPGQADQARRGLPGTWCEGGQQEGGGRITPPGRSNLRSCFAKFAEAPGEWGGMTSQELVHQCVYHAKQEHAFLVTISLSLSLSHTHTHTQTRSY
jgi:hypothetical protein